MSQITQKTVLEQMKHPVDPRINRRMFLRGASGVSLAIPFLPSLLSRTFASENPIQVKPRFFALRTSHGEVWGGNMYPEDTVLTQTLQYAGRTVRHGVYTPWRTVLPAY